MRDHTCDRKGPPAKVIDESGDEPITCIYPMCSVCGVPQVFDIGMRAEQLAAQLATLSAEQQELITRLVDLCASAAELTLVEDRRGSADAALAELERSH